jgi:uncharacterized protein involved in type VI secretion and phage assembly
VSAVPDGAAPGYYGVYPALVTRLIDPPRQGQVQVRFPSLGTDGDRDVRAWASLCSPYADGGHGLQILPEVGTQVLVAFASGQLGEAYILGACWNGQAAPPEQATEANNLRLLKSRAESTLTFDDTAGSEKVTIDMRSGHRIVLDNKAREIVVHHSSGPVITLTAAGEIKLSCTTVEVTAAQMNVNAATSTFSEVVNCKVLNASVSVSSPLYSVGVGNLL